MSIYCAFEIEVLDSCHTRSGRVTLTGSGVEMVRNDLVDLVAERARGICVLFSIFLLICWKILVARVVFSCIVYLTSCSLRCEGERVLAVVERTSRNYSLFLSMHSACDRNHKGGTFALSFFSIGLNVPASSVKHAC